LCILFIGLDYPAGGIGLFSVAGEGLHFLDNGPPTISCSFVIGFFPLRLEGFFCEQDRCLIFFFHATTVFFFFGESKADFFFFFLQSPACYPIICLIPAIDSFLATDPFPPY